MFVHSNFLSMCPTFDRRGCTKCNWLNYLTHVPTNGMEIKCHTWQNDGCASHAYVSSSSCASCVKLTFIFSAENGITHQTRYICPVGVSLCHCTAAHRRTHTCSCSCGTPKHAPQSNATGRRRRHHHYHYTLHTAHGQWLLLLVSSLSVVSVPYAQFGSVSCQTFCQQLPKLNFERECIPIRIIERFECELNTTKTTRSTQPEATLRINKREINNLVAKYWRSSHPSLLWARFFPSISNCVEQYDLLRV